MAKLVFLEGLPGVGKTTIINSIKNKNNDNLLCIDEIIKENIINNVSTDENEYLNNDNMKLELYYKYKNSDKIIIMDRGPLSTLSYNQARHIMDNKHEVEQIEQWFENLSDIYSKNVVVYYLTNNGMNHQISVNDPFGPFGNINGQKLFESICKFNANKYFTNVVIKYYDKSNMEEIIDEIIN